jgi:hypothetical protein
MRPKRFVCFFCFEFRITFGTCCVLPSHLWMKSIPSRKQVGVRQSAFGLLNTNMADDADTFGEAGCWLELCSAGRTLGL